VTLRPIRLTDPDLDQFDGWLKSRQINLITRRLYLSAVQAVAAANGGRVPLDPLESDAAADRVGGARTVRRRRRQALHRFADWHAARARVARARLDNPGWLREQYAAHERSTRDIGREIGVSHGTVLGALRRYDIPRRAAPPGRPRGAPLSRPPSAPDGWRGAIDAAIADVLARAVDGGAAGTHGVQRLDEGGNLIVPAHLITDAILALPGYTGVSRSWLQGRITRAMHAIGAQTRTRGRGGALSYSCPRAVAERAVEIARPPTSAPQEAEA